MRSLCVLALLSVAAGTAGASSLTIDLPLVNGVPTLSGTPGEVVTVDATITADTPLVLGDLSITQNTREGVAVGADWSIYHDPSNNFFAAEAPTTTPLPVGDTTGQLVTISFPVGAPAGLAELDYTLFYGDSGASFSGFFDVITQPVSSVPEPSYFGLAGISLGLLWLYRRRKSVG